VLLSITNFCCPGTTTCSGIRFIDSEINQHCFLSFFIFFLYVHPCISCLQFIQDYGLEADRSCLRYLFTVLNLQDSTPNVASQLQAKLLGAHLQRQLQSSSFVTNICIAFDQHFGKQKVCLKNYIIY